MQQMVRTYLRYEKAGVFGLVSSGALPCFDAAGKLMVTSALENVAVWNVKQGTLVGAGLKRLIQEWVTSAGWVLEFG